MPQLMYRGGFDDVWIHDAYVDLIQNSHIDTPLPGQFIGLNDVARFLEANSIVALDDSTEIPNYPSRGYYYDPCRFIDSTQVWILLRANDPWPWRRFDINRHSQFIKHPDEIFDNEMKDENGFLLERDK